ncbi:conserved protein of unknown function [Rhodovastum atsumiense]|uniref:G8 domain-containing protein n=1 Tax=Rhodovastum atsumiense TaxID=504468 RepID=A0A5M6IP44_9PROT|nr:hypothetical protein [Rhodovastum atsumiense]KAA5610036.1 hypothetical protein F1189_21260 [Rhodovastum atsumiense]CAH2602976.1 conserved protein of unknown function [Rhodovastum atsumiense]
MGNTASASVLETDRHRPASRLAVAVRDGAWFDPRTWAGRQVPRGGADLNVAIAPGVDVTFAGGHRAPFTVGNLSLRSGTTDGATLSVASGTLDVRKTLDGGGNANSAVRVGTGAGASGRAVLDVTHVTRANVEIAGTAPGATTPRGSSGTVEVRGDPGTSWFRLDGGGAGGTVTKLVLDAPPPMRFQGGIAVSLPAAPDASHPGTTQNRIELKGVHFDRVTFVPDEIQPLIYGTHFGALQLFDGARLAYTLQHVQQGFLEVPGAHFFTGTNPATGNDYVGYAQT